MPSGRIVEVEALAIDHTWSPYSPCRATPKSASARGAVPTMAAVFLVVSRHYAGLRTEGGGPSHQGSRMTGTVYWLRFL